MDAFAGSLALFAVAVVAALAGVLGQIPSLLAVAKPVATIALIGVVAPHPGDAVGILFAAGIVLSAAGDVALLFESMGAFLAGVVLFLFAHLAYAAAFLIGDGFGPSWTPAVGLVIFGLASAYLVRTLLPGVGERIRMPLVVYAAGITVMASAALATLAGPWPEEASWVAAVGGTLFYLSDVNLAWSRFRDDYPRARAVTLGLYWAGQLGIALAARWRY